MFDPLDCAVCAHKVTLRTMEGLGIMKKPTLDQMTKALRGDEGDKAVTADELQTVMATGLLHDLWDAARKGTVTSANRMQVRALLGLEPAQTATFNPNSFSLVVNYGAKLEDVVRMGQYGYVNPNFTSANFPTELTGTVTLEGGCLVHFGRDTGTEAALKKLDEMGLRPGNAHELAAFGAAFPEEQRKCPIVALGGKRWQNPRGGACVACLGRWYGLRRLNLCVARGVWSDDCRFLAFPK